MLFLSCLCVMSLLRGYWKEMQREGDETEKAPTSNVLSLFEPIF